MEKFEIHGTAKSLCIVGTILSLCMSGGGAAFLCWALGDEGLPQKALDWIIYTAFAATVFIPAVFLPVFCWMKYRKRVIITHSGISLYCGRKETAFFPWTRITVFGVVGFTRAGGELYFCTAAKEEIWSYWYSHAALSRAVHWTHIYNALIGSEQGRWQLAVGTYLLHLDAERKKK